MIEDRLIKPAPYCIHIKKTLTGCALLAMIFFAGVRGFAEAERLPGAVVPEHYQLKFAPDLVKDSFAGEETIDVRILQPASNVTLNAAGIKFKEATISSGGITQPARVTLDAKDQMATLTVEKTLAAGPAHIHIVFEGTLNSKLRGFYRSSANNRKYAATQFEASEARRAFPCFDEPAMKATFAVTLVVDKGDTAISNGKIIRDTPGPEPGKHTLEFSTTARMSSYLVAMAVGDFQCVQGSSDGIPIRICATPDKKELGRFALESAEHILHYYDQYFGIKYPFGKLDVVAVPDFAAGAMENAGAIFFRERLLLIDDKTASLNAHQAVTGVLAHEMGHMWFGDLVTLKWWNEMWLNEGLTTWVSGKPVRAWKPEWNGLDMGGVVDADSVKSPRPIRSPKADAPAEIIYGKAANVARMFEAYEGPAVFRAGVIAYLKAHEYGNATSEDFWNAQAKVSGKPINKMMPTFVDQPGAPLIEVEAKHDGGSTLVTLTQRRFYRDRAAFAKGSNELWQVPVCLRSAASGKQATQWVLLTRRTETYKLHHLALPVMANAGEKGYYRVAYSPEALHGLERVAETALTPAERIGLLNDVWAMVQGGIRPVGDYLSLVDALKRDRTRSVVEAYAGRLGIIDEDMVGDPEKENYRAWVRNLLHPAARELGWKPRPGESSDRRALRATVLATLGKVGRDQQVLRTARSLAPKYLADPHSIGPNLASTVINLAALEGDAELYGEILARTKTAKSPEDYYRFLNALAYFSDPALLTRTMEYALTPSVRGQDFTGLLAEVMTNPAGKDLAWDFVRKHWAEINNKPPGGAGKIFGAVNTFCDDQHLAEVKSFYAEKKVDSRTTQEAVENIGSCTDVKSLQEPQVAAWFQQQGSRAGQ
ncbi:MAG TPA: M1 family metallopeptidase [Terriglobia bacterium]|nr:M1 family metallopeptidase [Terriglobia bacterium]